MFSTLYLWLQKPIHWFLQNEVLRRVVKNSGYLFSTTGISAALSMVQGIFIARLLGVEGFGIFGTIVMFTSVVNKFTSFRMSELVIKYVGEFTESGERERAAAVFKLSIFTEMLASIIAFAIIWLLAPLGARYLAKDVQTTSLFVIYGSIVLANLIAESSTGLLQILDRFRWIAAFNLLQSMVTLLIVLIVYLKQGNLMGVLLAFLVGKAASALGLTLAAQVEAARIWGLGWWRSSLRRLQARAGELMRFAVSTNISATLNLINKDSELLWVSFFRSPLETGYYKLALSLINLLEMPVLPLPQTTYPELSRQVARRNWGGVRNLLRQGSFLAGGYTVMGALFLIPFGQLLIRWLYTAEFLPAYGALVILIVGYLAANTFYWRRVALLSLGYAGFPAKLNFILALLKLGGILILVPKYGYLASAALLAGFYWCGSIASVWKVRTVLAGQKEG